MRGPRRAPGILQDRIEDPWAWHAAILALAPLWVVAKLGFERAIGEVHIELVYPAEAGYSRPERGKPCRRRERRRRNWRHLGTCQDRTMTGVLVLRVQGPVHGVRQIGVPRAEPGSGFTLLVESGVVEWLRGAKTPRVPSPL